MIKRSWLKNYFGFNNFLKCKDLKNITLKPWLFWNVNYYDEKLSKWFKFINKVTCTWKISTKIHDVWVVFFKKISLPIKKFLTFYLIRDALRQCIKLCYWIYWDVLNIGIYFIPN